jgi:hypothetical protein
MAHIFNPLRHAEPKKHYTKEEREAIMNERRWQYVQLGISEEVLEKHFDFLNNGVVIRSGAEGIPMMTTTGIYGPIEPNQTVILDQSRDRVVIPLELSGASEKKSLLHELKERRIWAKEPRKEHSVVVKAKWVSGKDGGGLPNVGSSSNVFGATGSLLVNETDIDFPVIEHTDKHFDETLAFYGAKLLKPDEAFHMGYDKPLFGMEYDTRLPGYIQDYVMHEHGGGGLFVEHHPFPHIWFPSDGHAIAVDECCIHNDSFCNGKQVVFLADTDANTVALRETAPFKNLRISEKEVPSRDTE